MQFSSTYVTFAAVLAGAWAVLSLSLWRSSKDWPVQLGGWAAVAAALLVGDWMYVQNIDGARRNLSRNLEGLAPTYALVMQSHGITRVTLDTAPDDPTYLGLIELQKQLLAANPGVADIYTLTRKPDGTFAFLVDSETDYDHDGAFDAEREQRTPIGEVYEPDGESFAAAWEGAPSLDLNPYTDRWGTWLSAVVPIRDDKGHVHAILGVDYPADLWLADVRAAGARAMAQAACLFVLVVAAACNVSLSRRNVRRARADAAEIERLNRQLSFRIRAIDEHAIVACTDPSGRITYANDRFCSISGYAREELIGQDHRIVNSGRHERKFWTEVYRVIAGGAVWRGEVCNRRKDGSLYWVDTTIVPFLDAAGRVQQHIVIRSDVTHHKRIEQELQDAKSSAESAMRLARYSEREFRLLADAAPVMIWVAGTDGRRTYYNQQWLDFTGRTRAAEGDGWLDTVHPDDARRCDEIYRDAFERKQAFQLEYRRRRHDGEYRWLMCRAVPRLDESGRFLGYVGTCTDVTDLRNAREAAEAANLAKSQFLANMSHEIRTPMTSILGFAEILDDPQLSPPQRSDYIRTIRRNGQHLLGILNDVLDLSKVEAGQMKISLEPVSPAAVIEQVLSMTRVQATNKDLALHLEHRGDAPLPAAIQSDPQRLRQILTNLLTNAIKFTDAGHVKLITTAREYGDRCDIEFVVEDTGCGISDEALSRLFQPFTQADPSTTRRYGGTGLGLTLSRRFARILGGDVTVTSTPGKGSRFALRLPARIVADAAQAAGAAAPATSTAARPLHGMRVLVAEDGPDNQRLIAFHLKRFAADATIVADGQAAVEAARVARADGRPFDRIVLDMQMPVLDGYGAAAALRAEGFATPVIALTAHAMDGDRDKCVAAGCTDFVTKPFDPAKLLAALLADPARRAAA
jgi:PAS domain S-box-containing protein